MNVKLVSTKYNISKYHRCDHYVPLQRETYDFLSKLTIVSMGLSWITVTALMLLISEEGNSLSPGQTGYVLIQCATLTVKVLILWDVYFAKEELNWL